MNIIFLCRHNIFRSRTAEEYFKKINKNPEVKVSSAGLIPDKKGDTWSGQKKALLKEAGLSFKPRARGVSAQLLKKQDLIVVVATDIPPGLLTNKVYVKKIVYWGIPDVFDGDVDGEKKAFKIVKDIMKKCDELNEKLSAKKEVVAACP